MSYIGKTPEAVGGVPLMTPIWCPSRANLPPGYVPMDGQLVLRSFYPDATLEVLNGRVPVVSEAAWATATNRGSYTTGDGSTTIRVPDFNGKSAGSLGAVFLRGDGTNSVGTNGVIQLDAMQGHQHTYLQTDAGESLAGRISLNDKKPLVSSTTSAIVSDGTNGTPRIAAETRPLNVTGCWAVKLFGVVTAQAILDTQAVAATVSANSAAIAALGLQKDYYGPVTTMTSGALTNFTHGLGAIPKIVTFELVCLTAEFGYSIGDIIEWYPSFFSTGAEMPSVTKTSTQVQVRLGSSPPKIGNKTTGASQTITVANWNYRVRAFA